MASPRNCQSVLSARLQRVEFHQVQKVLFDVFNRKGTEAIAENVNARADEIEILVVRILLVINRSSASRMALAAVLSLVSMLWALRQD
jgi:hypothetical protein